MAKNSYESSMTDLMISLALIFMLLLAAVMLKLNNQAGELTQTKNELITQLTEVLSKTGNIEIVADKNDPLSLVIVLGESSSALKFEKGKYSLGNSDKVFLNKLMPQILNILHDEKYRSSIDSLKIEGYTDNDPYVGSNNYSNVELSQARALEVLNYTRKYALQYDNDVRTFFIDKASINGKGDIPQYWIKKTDGSGNCDKEKSRRVEIKIKIKSKDEQRLAKNLNSNE